MFCPVNFQTGSTGFNSAIVSGQSSQDTFIDGKYCTYNSVDADLLATEILKVIFRAGAHPSGSSLQLTSPKSSTGRKKAHPDSNPIVRYLIGIGDPSIVSEISSHRSDSREKYPFIPPSIITESPMRVTEG